MYVLIILIFSLQSSSVPTVVTTQEFTDYNHCMAAKQAVEQAVTYTNMRSVSCVAK